MQRDDWTMVIKINNVLNNDQKTKLLNEIGDGLNKGVVVNDLSFELIIVHKDGTIIRL